MKILILTLFLTLTIDLISILAASYSDFDKAYDRYKKAGYVTV